jgi:hypothetical protein
MENKKWLINVEYYKNVLERFKGHLLEFGKVEAAECATTIIKGLKLVPTVDAVEVVHGHWKRTNMYDEESCVQCSACLMEFDYIDGMCYLVTGRELPFYCPNCGAKMDGD